MLHKSINLVGSSVCKVFYFGSYYYFSLYICLLRQLYRKNKPRTCAFNALEPGLFYSISGPSLQGLCGHLEIVVSVGSGGRKYRCPVLIGILCRQPSHSQHCSRLSWDHPFRLSENTLASSQSCLTLNPCAGCAGKRV